MSATDVPHWIAAIDSLRDEHGVPGAVVALRVSGEERLRIGLGHADLEGTSPLDPDARFPTYSMTKTMTAVVALRLAELGRIDLDATLDRWRPELTFSSRVTLRRMLNHSAGIPNYSVVPAQLHALAASPRRAWRDEDFVREVCQRDLDFEPGAGWNYSNTGYFLVRRVLEEVGEGTLGDLIARYVCAPLGLEETFEWTDVAGAARFTPGFTAYWREDESREDMRGRYDPGWCATGVMGSTAREVCLFFEDLFGAKLLAPSSLDQMRELLPVPHPHPGGEPHYGLGLMALLNGRLGAEYGHGGGGPGYTLHASHFPSLAVAPTTICVMCNADADAAWPLLHAVAERWAEGRD